MKQYIICMVILAYFSHSSFACTCIRKNKITPESEYKRSHLVVVGKVIERTPVVIWEDTSWTFGLYQSTKEKYPSEKMSNYDSFKLRSFGFEMLDYKVLVLKKYKGQITSDTVTIRTGLGGGDCGYEFELGKKYLIYSVNESSVKYNESKIGRSEKELRGIFRTDICFNTQVFNRRADDIRYLKLKK